MKTYNLDWADLAFGSKKAVNALEAIFIAAPRELSAARLTQLIKTYLPKANIILGIANEDFILGFEGQPQFKTLRPETVEPMLAKVNGAKLPHKIYTLSYAQRDLKFVVEKLLFRKILFVNGSWQYVFHSLPVYHVLASKKLDYDMLSPFASEKEATDYAAATLPTEIVVDKSKSYSAKEMLALAGEASKRSFDYCFQTGVTLGRKSGSKYSILASSYNKVVPYQTYAMHHGSVRETNFSPMNDLNHYDTIHAEVALIVEAGKNQLDLSGTTLFINLLPCPTCARMFCETDITEIIYSQDHSDGYAVKLLEAAGIKVTRVVQ